MFDCHAKPRIESVTLRRAVRILQGHWKLLSIFPRRAEEWSVQGPGEAGRPGLDLMPGSTLGLEVPIKYSVLPGMQ